MKKYQGYFQTRDELDLNYCFYQKGDALQTLIILHGHGEHIGRYEKFPGHLKSFPISIALYDMRGYGRSEGDDVYVDSFEDFIEDVTDFSLFLQSQYGVKKKIILFGHSLGGLIAYYWATRYPDQILGLILSSPCLGLRLPAMAPVLNRFVNRFFPRLIYKNPVYPPYLTHNIAEVELYKKDPLIKRKISARLLSEMIRYSLQIDTAAFIELSFPFYVLMSGLDKIVDKEKTQTIFNAVQTQKKDLTIFEGFYHEIFNELGQEKVFEKLKVYLGEILDASCTAEA